MRSFTTNPNGSYFICLRKASGSTRTKRARSVSAGKAKPIQKIRKIDCTKKKRKKSKELSKQKKKKKH